MEVVSLDNRKLSHSVSDFELLVQQVSTLGGLLDHFGLKAVVLVTHSK